MTNFFEPTIERNVRLSEVCDTLSARLRRDDSDRIVDMCIGACLTMFIICLVYVVTYMIMN